MTKTFRLSIDIRILEILFSEYLINIEIMRDKLSFQNIHSILPLWFSACYYLLNIKTPIRISLG